MKLFIMCLLVLNSTHLFAQIEYDEKSVVTKTMVSVSHLNCILPQGSDERIYTQLGVDVSSMVNAMMNHSSPSINGCDRSIIDLLLADAQMRFSFVSVNIELRSGISKKPRLVFGKCQRNYKEQIFVKFDHGLVLQTSSLGKLIPANDC